MDIYSSEPAGSRPGGFNDRHGFRPSCLVAYSSSATRRYSAIWPPDAFEPAIYALKDNDSRAY